MSVEATHREETSPIAPAPRAPHRPRRLLGLLPVIAIAASATVSAEQATVASDEAPHIVLHYERQSLDSNAGVHTLYRRIVQAAEEVCPEQPGSGHVLSPSVRACRAQAIAEAVRAVDSPRLAALYEKTRGRG